MSIGTALGTAALIGGGLSAAGGLASSLIGSNAAKTAASDQEQASEAAIAEQQREFNQQQANYAPWLAAGGTALSALTSGTAPGGSLVTPYGATYQTPAPFTAPTGVDESNDPGYAFRLAQGNQAIQRAAAASGGAFSGGTLKALSRYGQDYASNEYQNVYNRALTGYNTNVNTGLNAFNTQFNAYNTSQGNTFNRLASLAGMGQTATGQLGQLGQSSAANIGNLLTGQGNAAAAGALGGASAINSGLNTLVGGTNNALNLYTSGQLLQALTGGSGGGGGGSLANLGADINSNYDSAGNFIPAGTWTAP
jgi:hypothetical protein